MTQHSPSLGPVELVVLTFPGRQIDTSVSRAFIEVIDSGAVTTLDLIYLAKNANGAVSQIEIDDSLLGTGLEGIEVEALDLVSDEDLEVIRSSMEPGTAAVVLVYEQTWARTLAGEVREGGGEVMLHVQIPRDTVDTVLTTPSTE